jgi:hypothetical protein
VRESGYPDKNQQADRLHFGGIHRVGERQASTGLTMQLAGYDGARGRITDATGRRFSTPHPNPPRSRRRGRREAGELATAWPFSGLLAHWSRKHTRAAYVPSMRREVGTRSTASPSSSSDIRDAVESVPASALKRQYAYGSRVRLAQRTDPLRGWRRWRGARWITTPASSWSTRRATRR